MRSAMRAAAGLAVAVGLVAAGPAAADDTSSSKQARAAGSDVVELTYPSIVQVRVKRAERALDRATNKIEAGQNQKAAAKLKVVRRQTAAAWRGAKYVIRTTPPPPPAEDARVRVRAYVSGDAPAGGTYAGPADTAFRVLTLQHDIATATVGLIDGAHGAGLNALSTTLNLTNDRRHAAIKYIASVAPAPPAEDARVRARAAGDAPVTAGFETVMPNVVPQVDDELQAIEGTTSDATDLTAGGRRLLDAAEAQVSKTKTFVNTTWPPVPQED
jgi:hypothetical protein